MCCAGTPSPSPTPRPTPGPSSRCTMWPSSIKLVGWQLSVIAVSCRTVSYFKICLRAFLFWRSGSQELQWVHTQEISSLRLVSDSLTACHMCPPSHVGIPKKCTRYPSLPRPSWHRNPLATHQQACDNSPAKLLLGLQTWMALKCPYIILLQVAAAGTQVTMPQASPPPATPAPAQAASRRVPQTLSATSLLGTAPTGHHSMM